MRGIVISVFGLAMAIPGSAQVARIPVVENDRPLWVKGKEWRVGDKPVRDIGSAQGNPQYELSTIRAMLRLQDGTIVVANQGTELRFYDRAGKFVRTVGRQGEGPTDFFQISSLVQLRDGNIGVVDFRSGIKVYSPDGRFIRLQSFPAGVRSAPGVIFDDASFIQGNRPRPRRGVTTAYTDSVMLVHYSPQGAADSVGRFPISNFLPRPDVEGGFVHFGPVFMQAARGTTWYTGFPERWEVTQRTPTGQPQRVIRRAWERVEITPAERQAFRTAMLNVGGEGGAPVSSEMRANRERLYADESFAKTLPAFGRLHVDEAGNLWAQVPPRIGAAPTCQRFHDTNDKPQEWSVFDASGRWLGQVTLPGNFWMFDIGNDYILGLWRDEFDVEHVRQYALVKPR